MQLPHLDWHGAATGEAGEGRASDKSGAAPATAAVGDLIAVCLGGGDVK